MTLSRTTRLLLRYVALAYILIRSDATGTHLRDNADVIVSERPLARVGEPMDVAEAVRALHDEFGLGRPTAI